jgi:hypothetical protein
VTRYRHSRPDPARDALGSRLELVAEGVQPVEGTRDADEGDDKRFAGNRACYQRHTIPTKDQEVGKAKIAS